MDRLVLLRITAAGFLVFVLGTTKVMTERGFPGSWLYIKMQKKQETLSDSGSILYMNT